MITKLDKRCNHDWAYSYDLKKRECVLCGRVEREQVEYVNLGGSPPNIIPINTSWIMRIEDNVPKTKRMRHWAKRLVEANTDDFGKVNHDGIASEVVKLAEKGK